MSNLKSGRTKNLSATNMQKIANYFQVSTDIFNEGVFEETLPDWADMQHLYEIQMKFALKKDNFPSLPKPEITDDDIKFALFGGDGEITDDMYAEVKDFAAFVKKREQEKKNK